MISVAINLLIFVVYVSAQEPAIVLPQGRVVGIKVYPKQSVTPVEIFFGIPYATAPTGRYRFSAPERHPGWRRTFFAHRMPPRCPQIGDTENDLFSEDCLFLNIWTPRRADSKAVPVVVILYSESWSRAGVTSLPCEELAAEGVVVVTVAFRLHLLGFFTLRSKLARGNLGLLDQYLALVWIRENIAAFGGDPAAITLMGHSAGADSVLQHLASPRSQGMFQRAILMSPRYIWRALADNFHADLDVDVEKVSREMAREIGCRGEDEEIIQCLRDRPLAEIMKTYKNLNWSNAIEPIADKFLPESEQYMPKSLSTAMSASRQPTAQLDLLVGATDLEAITHYEEYDVLARRGSISIIDYATNKIIPELLRILSFPPTDAYETITEAVKWEFWGDTHLGVEKVDGFRYAEGLARARSSVEWGVGTALLAARLARRYSRLYVYRYSQPAGVDMRGRQLNFTGAAHGTDLVTLLGDAMLLQLTRRRTTSDQQGISSLFRRYIINFVKYGSPATDNEWARYKAGDAHVQDIHDVINSCAAHETKRHVAFWTQYLPHLYNSLSAPERTEQFTSSSGEGRLRGGVFALCGVSLVLLVLLCACAVLLRWQRAQRPDHPYDNH